MPLQIHTAAATRRAILIAAIVGLVALVVAVGLWFLLRGGGGATNCVPATSWSAWSDCSAPCAGWQYRTRPPDVLPSGGGTQCGVTDLVQSRTCNENVPCGLPCIPNPNPDSVAWSGCPSCAPAGTPEVFAWRVVPPLQEAGPGGTACPFGSVFQTSLCTDLPPCPPTADCEIATSTAVASSSCNALCGPGVQIVWHSITRTASGGGQGCDWNLLVTQEPCEGPPCPSTASCDASQEAWSPWGVCSTPCGTGWQYSTRAPTSSLDMCPVVRSQTCDGLLPTCSTETDCAAPTWEYLEALCYMQCAGMPLPNPPPTDDGLPFCSVSADLLEAACGSGAWPGSGACLEPQDCSLTAWSPWSSCSLAGCDGNWPQGGMQVSSRAIVSYAKGGGVPCADLPLTRWQPCNNMEPVPYQSLSSSGQLIPATAPTVCVPHDCSLSAWYPASDCSAQCGDGWQYWARSITVLPSGGGTCPSDPSDYVTSRTCQGTHGETCGSCVFMSLTDYLDECTWKGINPWSACSAACDGTMTLSLPVSISAPPGGWCSYSDSIVARECCSGCVCNDACPVVGLNGVPCSGFGACHSVSDAYLPGGWSFSCDCEPGYAGAACDIHCPSGPTGLVCNGHGTCDFAAGGKCVCDAGYFGDTCEANAYCYVMGMTCDTQHTCAKTVPFPQGYDTVCYERLMGQISLTADFTADHCMLLGFVPPAAVGMTVNSACDGTTDTQCAFQGPSQLMGILGSVSNPNLSGACGFDAALLSHVQGAWPAELAAVFGVPTFSADNWVGATPPAASCVLDCSNFAHQTSFVAITPSLPPSGTNPNPAVCKFP